MKSSVIFFVSFCIAYGTSTVPAVPVLTHVKSISNPYHSPVHVTGFSPLATMLEAPVLKAHSYTTKIRHLAPVAVASPVVSPHAALAPVKSIGVVGPALGPVKSSIATEIQHTIPVLAAPAVPVEVAPAPVIVHADGPVKSSAIKAFSFATEVKHEVPIPAAPLIASPVITEQVVKSIHAPAAVPLVAHAPAIATAVKSINVPVIAPQVFAHAEAVVSAPVPVIAHAEGPIKSSAIKAFSFATEVKHEVPVAAVPLVDVPQLVAHAGPVVKSIHAPVSAPVPLAKSIHNPVIASHAPAVAPLTNLIHSPVLGPAPAIAPLAKPIYAPAIAHAPAAIAPLAKSIHSPSIAYAPAIAPAAKSIHSPAIATNRFASGIAPYIAAIQRGVPLAVGAHAPALSAAGLIGAGYTHPLRLARRLPVGINVHRGIYGGVYNSYPRLYASLAAPGAALWRGHPVSSGVAYLGGISRGAFGYHPIPVHYQGYRSPVHGVWNYFRG